MSGNALFVQKGTKIAFSDYFVKQNKTLLSITPEGLLNLKRECFWIPIDSRAISLMGINKFEEEIKTYFDSSCPVGIKINEFGDIIQYSNVNDKIETIYSFANPGTFLARATKWSLECAASAACVIYDDVSKIYEEAYYSTGSTPPPYFVADVKNIAEALSSIKRIVPLNAFLINAVRDKTKLKSLKTQFNKSPSLSLEQALDIMQTNKLALFTTKKQIIETMQLVRYNDFF